MKTSTNNHGLGKKSIWGNLDTISPILLMMPIMKSITGETDSFELIFYSVFCTILYAISFFSNRKRTLPQSCPIWYFAIVIILSLCIAFFPAFLRQLIFGTIVLSAILQITLSIMNIRALGKKTELEFRQTQVRVCFIGMMSFLLAARVVYQWMLG